MVQPVKAEFGERVPESKAWTWSVLSVQLWTWPSDLHNKIQGHGLKSLIGHSMLPYIIMVMQ